MDGQQQQDGFTKLLLDSEFQSHIMLNKIMQTLFR